MDNQNQVQSKEKALSKLNIIAWIIGIVTIVIGLGIILKHFLSGVLVLLAAIVILPPAYKAIKAKINFSLSKSARIFFYTLFLVIGVIGGITSPKSETKNISAVPVQQTVFDIPSLVGKNVDEISVALENTDMDTELRELQNSVNAKEWDKTYTRSGFDLLITYSVQTKKVVDIFLSTNDPEGMTSDTEGLLKAGNLSRADNRYSVKFVEALKNPGYYTGVIVKER